MITLNYEEAKRLFTWSELDALEIILVEVEAGEYVNFLDLSKKSPISRTNFATMLKKLTALKLIETQSLGAKGTLVVKIDKESIKKVLEG